jgi:hypothetical protein
MNPSMVFFLALLPHETVRTFLNWAYEHLSQQRPAFQARFRGAIEGLALAAGASLNVPELRAPASAPHCFLGWTSDRHWLLADQWDVLCHSSLRHLRPQHASRSIPTSW